MVLGWYRKHGFPLNYGKNFTNPSNSSATYTQDQRAS